MHKLIVKRKVAVLLVSAVIVSGGVLAGATVVRSANSPAVVTVADISPAALSSRGIELTVSATTSTVAAGAAAAVAASNAFDAPVIESHFAHCVAPGGVDQDCWAISLDPSSFQSGSTPGSTDPPIQATYMIVLVDPASDQILHSQDGAGS